MPAQMAIQSSAELARVIHDDILQLLGVCLLETELCRRFWKKGQADQVMAELDAILTMLESAVNASHDISGALERVLPRAFAADCRRAVKPDGPTRIRPLLVVVDAAPPPAPVVDPAEILPTLSVCLLQAELCRRLYQSGHDQPALRELNLLSQRLDAVVEAYRAVMSRLRERVALARTA